MSVDAQRYCCTVKTINGQRYDNVIWVSPSGGGGRASSSFTPKMGDRVKLSTGLGYPVIDGFLPRIDRDPSTPLSIDTGTSSGDTGKLSPLTGDSYNSGKAGDMLAGDTILSSEGGGMMGVLRAGTVLLKASVLAQIILSKFDDCVRLVGRNIEFMSEVGVDVYASVKGTVYKYSAYARSVAEARAGIFRYQEMYGDVNTAASLKDTYELGSAGGSATPGGPLKRVMVIDGTGATVRIEETDLLGNVTTTTKTPDGSNYSTMVNTNAAWTMTTTDGTSTSAVNNTNAAWSVTTTNGTFCTVNVVKDTIVLNYNNDSTVTINATGIVTKKGSTVSQVLVDSILLDASGGHFVHITPAGVQLG